MKLVPTEKYADCLRLSEKSMKLYFSDNQIPWDFEKRLKLYSSFEIYEVFEDEFIGYLALRENQGSIFVADLQVVELHRNKGFGTKLLTMAKEIARSKGYDSIKLKAFKNSQAINLYIRNGYLKVGEEEYVYIFSSSI